MKIWASCKCCEKQNFIVKDYALGEAFSQKTEFGRKLFESLKNHLLALQNDLKSQGHYDRIFITPDAFTEENLKIPKDILDTFLPENKKVKPKKERRTETKENQFNLAGWLSEKQQGREGIDQKDYENLLKIIGTGRSQEQFTWEEIQDMLNGEQDYDQEE
ncbi:hypothetical protein [endosymbiont GvMRE of Glomus versiforme]|uniref:hypothetical protein n=1 Tax=endosymbiont GvMRE of Glomus versiforme TaxID=2039283 RepID=UPI000EEB70D5|nr:hypothetical protein [endosymbiont GvMRE of Glomus versiforme]RHZ37709.1 hypothetical protein GvMRE_I1g527 [endosymbiont GvMRE of Glomus versiforme]